MLALAYMSSTTAGRDLALSRAAPPWNEGTVPVNMLLVSMGSAVVTVTLHDSTDNGTLDLLNPYNNTSSPGI